MAWICFDLNGTLVDPRGLTGDERGEDVLDAVVLQAMADTLSGEWRPFHEHVAAVCARVGVDSPGAMPAFPDAAEALGVLRDAGFELAIVTNSSADAGRSTLAGAGLDGFFGTVVGAQDAGAYKPDRRVYDNAARELGGPQTLVAAHAWDCAGAVRAGWQAAWVGHREGRLLSTTPPLRAAEPTLLAVARALAGPR